MPSYRHVQSGHVESPTGERAKALAASPLWAEVEEGGVEPEASPEPLPRSAGGEVVSPPDDAPPPAKKSK